MSAAAFLDRVFSNLPAVGGSFSFNAWRHDGRPTSEGVGILPGVSVDVARMAGRIMDVGSYRGNIDYVEESRVIPDPAHVPPTSVHFYQRIKVPVLAEIQMELALTDFGDRGGWRVIGWHQLDAQTNALSTSRGARSEYNVGAWLIKPNAVGYALSSAPRKDDVGRLKFAALTKGADASAAKVVKANIEGMIRWSQR
jgi:hypothetical protein